jgi:hypothetical protein
VNFSLVVQHDTEEGIVHSDLAVVLKEAQFPEFVHEEIDPGPRSSNHPGQNLLGYFGEHLLKLARRAITREQQQSACQALLAGVKELVNQVSFDPEVSRQHIGNEAVGELTLRLPS